MVLKPARIFHIPVNQCDKTTTGPIQSLVIVSCTYDLYFKVYSLTCCMNSVIAAYFPSHGKNKSHLQ